MIQDVKTVELWSKTTLTGSSVDKFCQVLGGSLGLKLTCVSLKNKHTSTSGGGVSLPISSHYQTVPSNI